MENNTRFQTQLLDKKQNSFIAFLLQITKIVLNKTFKNNCFENTLTLKTRVHLLLFISLLTTPVLLGQTTLTSRATGNWNASDTWISSSLTGTITTSTSSNRTIVTGVNTNFIGQLSVGAALYRIDGTTLIGTVSSITSNTSLTLTANAANANSGVSFRTRKIPGTLDTVILSNNNFDVNIPSGLAASCASLEIGATGTNSNESLIFLSATSSLSVNGNVLVYGPSGNNNRDITLNTGTMTVGGNLELGTGQTGNNSNRISRLSISSGKITVSGNLVFNNVNGSDPAQTQINMSGGAGTFNLGGAFIINNSSGTLSSSTSSTFNFNGSAAQTIPIGVSSVVFNDINTNNLSGVTLSNTISTTNVLGNINVQTGILNNGGFSIVGGSGDTFSVTNDAVFNLSGTSVFPTGFGTTLLGITSTVNYNGTNQNIATKSYGNLELSTSGNKTFAGATTIAGNLTLSGTSIALLPNGSISSAASLSFSGVYQAATSWGGSNSAATNKSSAKFGSTTTGILNNGNSCSTASIAGATTVCSGANATTLTLSGNTGAIQWQTSSDNSAFSNIAAAISATYIASNLNATTYYRALATNGVCKSSTSGVTTVTVNSTSVGGTISGSATVCPGTNATSLSLSGNTGAIQWQNSSDNSVFSNIVSATETTYIASNLNATTYFRTVATNGVCSSANCPSVSVDVRTTTFNGTTWSNGNPASNATIIYNLTGNYTLPSDIAACSCTVTSGNLTVPSGKSMNLLDKLTVSSGSITFENNANLIQTNPVINSGAITVKRNSALQVRLDHTLWSSPVANVNLFGFSPLTLTNRFYTYDTATNTYSNTGLSASSSFITGKGIAVRAPNTFPTTPQTWEGVFTGIPNNGTISYTLETSGTGYNLVGNPYPSPIDAAGFISGNPNIGGALYFYAHTLTMGSNGLFPTGSNYAVLNGSGSTIATPGTSGVPSLLPNGIIQVGQGFIVKATGAGTVNFNNGMRVNNTQNQFFRNATTIERHRLWLNLSNDAGTDFNQILVGYVEGATMGVDSNFDALALGNTGNSLSSKIDGLDYTIQGRALAFSEDDNVLLGFKAAIAGNYTITLTDKDGLFLGNQPVYILDTTTNSTHEIKTTPYSFYSEAGTFDTRFQLVYSSTLGIPTSEFSSNSVVAYKKDGVFNVSSKKNHIKEILAYDNLGRLIFKQSNINSQTTSLTGLSTTNEILFLKIISQEDSSVTIKIIN